MLRSRRDGATATLVAFALVAFAAWFFIEIADDVLEGETRAFDEGVLLAMRSPAGSNQPVGPRWGMELARDVTGLGSTGILTFLTLASSGFLLLQRKVHLAAYLISAVATGALGRYLLKIGFDRPRPDLVAHRKPCTRAASRAATRRRRQSRS